MSTKIDPSLPGYDDLMALFLRTMAEDDPARFGHILRLAELPPEQLIAAVPPEQLLAAAAVPHGPLPAAH